MSDFVTPDDYTPFIKAGNLDRLLEQDSTILEKAEATALATVRDSLDTYYDTDTIFAMTGDGRPQQVIRWVIVLALYYCYERLPANMMPERAKDNYQEVMAWLKEIERGEKPVNLPHRTKDDGTGVLTPTTKFRYGSALPPRSHQL